MDMTNTPSGVGRQSLSMSREAVPNSNQRTGREQGISALRMTLYWTTGMRKLWPFREGLADGQSRPEGDLQGRHYERAEKARKRPLAEGIGLRQENRGRRTPGIASSHSTWMRLSPA